MAEHRDNGGDAFPSTDYFDEKPVGSSGGMTLRDWFAGKALANIRQHDGGDFSVAGLAADCYRMADAMLAERKK